MNAHRPALDEFDDLLRRQGLGEEKPLTEGAAQIADDLELLGCLDAFRQGDHAQVLSKRDDGLDDLGPASVAAQALDKALIDLEDVTFAYDSRRPVLDGADLKLFPGDRIGLTGTNGCGKTTLLHIIAGLLKPQSGSVRVFGSERRQEADFREVRARVGLVFQNADDQLFCPTVLEDVAFGPLNLGRTPDEARALASATLDRIGLAGFEDRITYRLSGGEKRLVALATVLSMDPEVLLLDEPVSGLDGEARSRVIEVLREVSQALLVVSHDRSLIRDVAHGESVLRDGRLTPPATPDASGQA